MTKKRKDEYVEGALTIGGIVGLVAALPWVMFGGFKYFDWVGDILGYVN